MIYLLIILLVFWVLSSIKCWKLGLGIVVVIGKICCSFLIFIFGLLIWNLCLMVFYILWIGIIVLLAICSIMFVIFCVIMFMDVFIG